MPRPGPGLLGYLSSIGTKQLRDDVVTLAKLEHGTAGDVLLYDATGVPIRLANAGKEGRILRAKGSGDLVEWALPPIELIIFEPLGTWLTEQLSG